MEGTATPSLDAEMESFPTTNTNSDEGARSELPAGATARSSSEENTVRPQDWDLSARSPARAGASATG